MTPAESPAGPARPRAVPDAAVLDAAVPDRLRPLAALASGLIMLVAFPPYGLWWAAPIGVAALALTVHGRRLRAGFGLGTLAGVACFAPLLSWTNLHTGMVPWLLLSALEAPVCGAARGGRRRGHAPGRAVAVDARRR